MPAERAWATEQPRDETEWMVPMGLSLVALSVPLGVNTYSAVSEPPVSHFWDWSGYIIGGFAALSGTFAVVGNLNSSDADTTKTYAFLGVLGYGVLHLAVAYSASEIEPESTAGVLVPMVGTDEYGARRIGLTWVKRF